MNSAQTLITIAALALIVVTILNFNRSSLTTQDNLNYNKEYIATASAAESLLDEISGKAFDENIIIGTTILNAANFSSSLAPESGEVYPNFDDIDDYNNLTKTDSIPNIGVLKYFVKVNYTTDNFLYSNLNTYHKLVTVKVTNSNLRNPYSGVEDTVMISTVLSQWKML